MKSIAILTTKNQWFQEYAKKLSKELKCSLYFDHNKTKNYDIVFILSYHNIIPENILKTNRYNIVIHASALPEGKGWAPMFWHILEGKNEIPFTMFEASDGVDNGDIYMQKTLELSGYELHDKLRAKQANFTIDMCLEFIQNYEKYKIPTPQKGAESFYKKRTKEDHELDTSKIIKEQFNLLRISSDENYPAFFELDGNRYILKIELEKMGEVELIDFVDMTLHEKQNVLQCRNHENIKKWMYDPQIIDLDTHIAFIESLIGDEKRQYLLVKKDGVDIGVVDFIFNNKEAFFGLYANPFEKIAGVGRVLEEICIRYVLEIIKLNKLKLEVFSDNNKAINLYKKFNFKETERKKMSGKEIICMELENETL